VEALVRLVDEMRSQGLTPSVVTYNTLILACRGPSAHRGGHDDSDDREEAEEERRLERALGLLHDMKREGLTPDVITLHSLVRVAIQDDEDDAGNRTRQRRKNAEDEGAGGGDARRQRGEAAARQVDRALALIDRLTADFPGLTPNTTLYNGLIALCQLGGRADKAVALYRRMREAGLQPTLDTFRSLLASLDHHNDGHDHGHDQAEAQTAAAKQAMELLEEMKRDGPAPTPPIYGKVIEVVVRGRGRDGWDEARGLVREMEARGLLVSAKVYNVLLGESVRVGDAQRAQEVLREMQRKDVPGDYKTSLLRKEAARLR
jgi:pentatricopeptide repeat protein